RHYTCHAAAAWSTTRLTEQSGDEAAGAGMAVSRVVPDAGCLLDGWFTDLRKTSQIHQVAAARTSALDLLDQPRQVLRARHTPILLCKDHGAFVAWLHVVLMPDGTGEFSP